MSGDQVSALASASQPSLAETLLIREAVSQKVAANLDRYTGFEQFYFVPRDWAIYQPRPIISALGMLAGHPDAATFAGAAAAVHQRVEVIDHQARVPFLLQSVLTPFTPTLGNAAGMPAFAYALNPKLPPEGLYVAEIAADFKKRQRQGLFKADVDQLEKKLQELTKDMRSFTGRVDKVKADAAKEAARKHIDQWLKDRGLTAIGTPQPLDRYQIASAPELKPLNEKALPEPDGTNSLAEKLFSSFDPRGQGGMTNVIYLTQAFDPFWFPSDPAGDALDKSTPYAWISEEFESKPYNTFDNANKLTNGEMTKRVDRAGSWKSAMLAKAEADRLADEVRRHWADCLFGPGRRRATAQGSRRPGPKRQSAQWRVLRRRAGQPPPWRALALFPASRRDPPASSLLRLVSLFALSNVLYGFDSNSSDIQA